MKRRDDGRDTTVEARVKRGASCCWRALFIMAMKNERPERGSVFSLFFF
jgi:hypothetical protein